MTITQPRSLILIGVAILGGLVSAWLVARIANDPGDAALQPFVLGKPPVPIVFTSRSEPASLDAPAAEGDGFAWPGVALWRAREGRLRILWPSGAARELTWGRHTSDGETIVDVMSPNVSHDGKSIVFAGRTDQNERFRLFEVGVDGTGLRRTTGGPRDAGCTAPPPLRTGPDGSPMSVTDRQRLDYDDVDPVYLPGNRVAFVSSRLPDLGRGHTRRSTQLWIAKRDGSNAKPLTANRNNDRWPFLLSSGYLAFSLWSRNTEVVTADGRDVRPLGQGETGHSQPTDQWMAAMIEPGGDRFGGLVKAEWPVWRPRPTPAGRIAYMTPVSEGFFRVDQATPGLTRAVPSARPANAPLPTPSDEDLWRGETRDASGQRCSMVTPSPCPPGKLVVATATAPPAYGITLVNADWTSALDSTPLFDDPDFVDAEPVAVYSRNLPSDWPEAPAPGNIATGQFVNPSLTIAQHERIPGGATDADQRPAYPPPPEGTVTEIRFYASRRDRFDDPIRPRIEGGWEQIATVPAGRGGFDAQVPAGSPMVLVGFGPDGKVGQWSGKAKDTAGRTATFLSIAGDHYTNVRAGKHHFCLGCHPGHSGIGLRQHAE